MRAPGRDDMRGVSAQQDVWSCTSPCFYGVYGHPGGHRAVGLLPAARRGPQLPFVWCCRQLGFHMPAKRGAGESGTTTARRNARFGCVHAWVHLRRHSKRDARASTGRW